MLKKTLDKPLVDFAGVLVLGLNGRADFTTVAVWWKGALLNDTNFREHSWPNWNTKTTDKPVIRHYPKVPGEVELMSKSEFKRLAGLMDLKSSQRGHKLYLDTLVGDVLYKTYDENKECFQESVRLGILDGHCEIHTDKHIEAKKAA